MFRRSGVPYVYLVHDLFPDVAVRMGALHDKGVLAFIGRRFQRKWLVAAKALVVNGRCAKATLAKIYGLSSEKVHVIPNWGDTDIIKPLPRETEFRSAHSLSGFLVIYSGNIGRAQRLNTVLNGAKIIPDTHPDVTFVLVGNGGAWSELAEIIYKEALTNVRLIPPVPWADYPDVLASADVSLVSYDSALLGMAVPSKPYNILASGRPMIAILDKDSEIAHLLEEHQCGLQVDHGDGTQFAGAALKLYEGGDTLRERMGQRARLASTGSYTVAIIAEQYHRLFHELVSLPESC
jgi:glycosyltransferase involved in cell wall biosynthesis